MSRKGGSSKFCLQRWFGWLLKGTRKCLGISRKEREQETLLVGDVAKGKKTRDYIGRDGLNDGRRERERVWSCRKRDGSTPISLTWLVWVVCKNCGKEFGEKGRGVNTNLCILRTTNTCIVDIEKTPFLLFEYTCVLV